MQLICIISINMLLTIFFHLVLLRCQNVSSLVCCVVANNKWRKVTETVKCDERFVIIKIGDLSIVTFRVKVLLIE